ncbi:hypothetical protein XENOCAPTIV_020157 [Xenoophorus captivus]|uniref:Exocyst complex subunit EXOC6/Sec15 C-terminal domain-containing protein n=1 Tax=Xenoophorus captivus TaxID=1517983 RepID=A0ABV0RUP0_9TELE
MIRKSTNLLLTRTLSNCLQYAIKKKNVGLAEDARHAAEAEIYTSLNAKIDQFLQLADNDWMSSAQGSGNLTTSDYLVDLIAFLRSTFSVFTNLPVSTPTLTATVLQVLDVRHCVKILTNL